jgi:RNA polymerase sigma-B factor
MTGSQELESDGVLHLFRRYHQSKDLRLRDEIVAQHLYLVQAVAKKFVGMGEPYEDLVQEGTMGLINAVDMYDVERGIKFSTYATHLVTGHIRHYLRDRGRIIRQPAWVQELSGKITKAAEAMRQQLKRDPTVDEIAERLNMAREGVHEILSARDRSKVASLDAPAADDEYSGPAIDVDKIRSARYATLSLPIEDKILLQEAVEKLKDLERKVVRYFFYHDLSQTEIARRMGISVNYASYLLRGALVKLRATFESQSRMPDEPDADRAVASRGNAAVGAASPGDAAMFTDPASGLACAPYFDERVRQEIERAKRYPQTFAVLLLETCRGEQSSAGRRSRPGQGNAAAPAEDVLAAGSEAVSHLSSLLRRSVRQVDVLARYGRTCFALLLPHTGREARILAERLVKAIPAALDGRALEPQTPPRADRDPAKSAPEQPAATTSLRVGAGYAVYPADGRTAERLIEGARRAARRAVEAGSTGASPAVERAASSRTAAR